MNAQINLKLPELIFNSAVNYAETHGYANLQEFIRETIRQKLFEDKELKSGIYTYKASEESLAKNWLKKEEDKAWAHLQKET